MPFDIEYWKVVLLASAHGLADPNCLLEASSLIEEDYLEEDIDFLMRDIDEESDDADSHGAGRKKHPDLPRRL